MKLLTTGVSVLVSIAILVPSTSPKDICVVHWKSIDYNEVARQARMQGDVSLEVSVEPDGKVSEVRVSSSNAHKLLQDEAVKNITEWTFSTGDKRSFDIMYEFRLVMPEVYYGPPASVTIDFPKRVHIESHFKPISRD